jgi:hypothetical protein
MISNEPVRCRQMPERIRISAAQLDSYRLREWTVLSSFQEICWPGRLAWTDLMVRTLCSPWYRISDSMFFLGCRRGIHQVLWTGRPAGTCGVTVDATAPAIADAVVRGPFIDGVTSAEI